MGNVGWVEHRETQHHVLFILLGFVPQPSRQTTIFVNHELHESHESFLRISIRVIRGFLFQTPAFQPSASEINFDSAGLL